MNNQSRYATSGRRKASKLSAIPGTAKMRMTARSPSVPASSPKDLALRSRLRGIQSKIRIRIKIQQG